MGTNEQVIHTAHGEKEGYEAVRKPGFFSDSFAVRHADTKKVVTTTGSRKTAVEKTDELAKKH